MKTIKDVLSDFDKFSVIVTVKRIMLHWTELQKDYIIKRSG